VGKYCPCHAPRSLNVVWGGLRWDMECVSPMSLRCWLRHRANLIDNIVDWTKNRSTNVQPSNTNVRSRKFGLSEFSCWKFGLSEFPCWENRIVRMSLFVEKRELQCKQSDGDTSIFLTGEIANASCDGDRSSWAF